jgi:DNA-binding Lrp family transcriptional regulator
MGVGPLETVYVLLKTDPGMLEAILMAIRKLEGVKEASPVTGAYDIIVRIDGEFITDALSVVVKEIRKISGIQGTETLISVKL